MSVDILNVFNSDAFGLVSLTAAVNDMTPAYGILAGTSIFKEEGITQKTVAVDYDPVTNQLLPQSQWGGPGVANKTALSKSYSFNLPHFPINDKILAADLSGRRRPGTDAVQDAQYVTAKKMREMRTKLEQTKEWMMTGVLRGGIVQDGAGTTIVNLYSTYGISQTSTAFALTTSTTDVAGKTSAVQRNIQAALHGDACTGYVAFCSDGFFDALLGHPNVQKTYQYLQNPDGLNLTLNYSFGSSVVQGPDGVFRVVKGFKWQGVTWINYSGSVTDATGAAQVMIDANSAYMIPTGTEAFKVFYAPADYMETVNTEGLPFYAKVAPDLKFNKGVEIECQSNPLPICLKPAVIQKLTTT